MSVRGMRVGAAILIASAMLIGSYVVACGPALDEATKTSPDATSVDENDAALGIAPFVLACPPRSDAGPEPWKPPIARRPACATRDNIEQLVLCTIAFSPTCDSLTNPGLADCRACVFSESDAAEYGPIVHEDGYYRLNVTGCYATLANMRASVDCPAQLESIESCARSACVQCLPQGIPAFDDCVQAARTGPCAANVGCVDRLNASADLSPCRLPADFFTAATDLASFYCLDDRDAGDAGDLADAHDADDAADAAEAGDP